MPLDGARFRVAVDENGLGVSALAAALSRGRGPLEKSFKQTLHHHFQGKGTRIRAKVRRRLARLLNAPEQWLAGEDVYAPYGLYLVLRDPMQRSLKVSLAVTRLAERALEGVRRDLRPLSVRAPTPDGFDPAMVVQTAMSMVLARLVNVVHGIPQLLANRWILYARPGDRPSLGPDEPLPFETPELTLPTIEPLPRPVEDAYLAAVQTVRHLLDPWLRGVEVLDYCALVDLAELVNRGTKSIKPPTFATATAADIAAWRTTPRTSPYALIDWPAIDGPVPSPTLPASGPRRPSRTKRS